MSTCCSSFAATAQRHFGAAAAQRDLESYRRRGADLTTRLLRDAILTKGPLTTLLDVGAGVGALSFELLAAGATKAVAADAAPAHLAAAREEAGRRKLSAQLEVVPGDFVTTASGVSPADVVAMDRVVCCYPACEPLLEAALQRSQRLFAFSYPRNRWYIRAMIGLENRLRALRRDPFRTFVHSASLMEAVFQKQGFALASRHLTPVWAVDAYVRAAAA